MARNRCDGLLARVDFPLYALQTLTNRHILVAGGGGASNTGVANGFVSVTLLSYSLRKLVRSVFRYASAIFQLNKGD